MKDWRLIIQIGINVTVLHFDYLHQVTEHINQLDIIPIAIEIKHKSTIT